jgi:adenylate kinase family enzyme
MSIKLKVSSKIGNGEINIAPIKTTLKAGNSTYIEKNEFFSANVQLAIEKGFLYIEDINTDYEEIKNSLDRNTIKIQNVSDKSLSIYELKISLDKGRYIYLNTDDLKFKSLKDASRDKIIVWERLFPKQELQTVLSSVIEDKSDTKQVIENKIIIPEDDFDLEEVKSNYNDNVNPEEQEKSDIDLKNELDKTKTSMKAWDFNSKTVLDEKESAKKALKQVNSQNESLIEYESEEGVVTGNVDFNKIDKEKMTNEFEEIAGRKYVVNKKFKEGKKKGKKTINPVGEIREPSVPDVDFVPLGVSPREVDFVELGGSSKSNSSRKARQNEEVS